MKIFGRAPGDYVRMLAPLFGLIAAVWGIRFVLGAAGAPGALIRVFSVTVVGTICIPLAAILIHIRRFGGYAHLVVAVFLLVLWQQLLISGAIAFAIVTGTQNIFTAPEFSFPVRGPLHEPAFQLHHLVAHLTLGLGFGTLFGTGMGCLLFWMIKRLVPVESKGRT